MGIMRDVEHHHLDLMPSNNGMTIASHVHDVIRARLLVTRPTDVVSAVQKLQSLVYDADNGEVLRVENGFIPGQEHACREVRVYLRIKDGFLSGLSAVAEVQI